MSGNAQKTPSKLGHQVAESQTRTFIELVIEVLNTLESHQGSRVDQPDADHRCSVSKNREKVVSGLSRTRALLILACALLPFLNADFSLAQSIEEQKKAVVFIFGTIHPLNPDKTAMTDAAGNRVAAEIPLGTGFFVSYPDPGRGPNNQVVYLVTAKHVLRDTDGAFLPNVKIRLNLKSPIRGSDFGFINDIPVSDPQGKLLWFHSEDQADDVVALPLLPDTREFDFASIPTTVFLKDRAVNSGAVTGTVAEGDEVYFIGLMAQYYGVKRNYPLVRRCALALLTDEYVETPSGQQKVFIAALESWPGNSGAPVFLLRGHPDSVAATRVGTRFLGIIVASFLNNVTVPLSTGTAGRELEAGDKANTGMTCVVPAPMVARILDGRPARQDRDAHTQRVQSVVR